MRGLIIATRQDKETKINVNFYLNFRFRICMSLIPLQATCLPLIKARCCPRQLKYFTDI
jgi:hypothetical protein